MPAHRMDRDQFHAELAGRDVEQLGRILWTLYWRGSAPMRQRIEAQLDPEAHAAEQRREQTLPDAATVRDRVREFAELARAGAYLAGDRRVSPKERTRWRFTFRDLADDARTALAAEDVEVAAEALELLIDLACETRAYEYFRSEDPMQAAGFVVSDAAAALWQAVRERRGFAAFVDRAPTQLLRWESRYGWTRTGDGKVAQQETSLAAAVKETLSAPDHWRAFATRYLEALDDVADRTAATTRRWSPGSGREPRERARALAEWHTMLLDRLIGSEDEPLLDRLVEHEALAGPELTFVQAQLAHRRGDEQTARQLVHDCLVELPGHEGFHELARRIEAPLPPRAQQTPAARR